MFKDSDWQPKADICIAYTKILHSYKQNNSLKLMAQSHDNCITYQKKIYKSMFIENFTCFSIYA